MTAEFYYPGLRFNPWRQFFTWKLFRPPHESGPIYSVLRPDPFLDLLNRAGPVFSALNSNFLWASILISHFSPVWRKKGDQPIHLVSPSACVPEGIKCPLRMKQRFNILVRPYSYDRNRCSNNNKEKNKRGKVFCAHTKLTEPL